MNTTTKIPVAVFTGHTLLLWVHLYIGFCLQRATVEDELMFWAKIRLASCFL